MMNSGVKLYPRLHRAFIRLTQLDGEPVYVNPEHVVLAKPYTNSVTAAVQLVTSTEQFLVTEPLDRVVEALNGHHYG